MSKRSKSKTKRSKSQTRKPTKKKVHVVPGYTRIGGAYGRAIPCGPEKKYKDTTIALDILGVLGTATNATGAMTPGFLSIAQGTSDVQRVGNLICVKNFNFRGVLTFQGVNTMYPQRVRVVFFWDFQANGAVSTIGDMFKGPISGAVATRQECEPFRNLDNVSRFKIIKDKTFSYHPNSQNATPISNGQQFPIKVSWKGDMPVHYSSSAGAITEMRSENLSFYAWSDNADGAGTAAGTPTYWNIEGVGRVKFTDM